MRTLKELFTTEELERLPTIGRRLELVDGKIYEMPLRGGRRGLVAMNMGIALGGHVRLHRLGRVFAAETGFLLSRDPDTVRAPDAAFVSSDRLGGEATPDGFPELAPDLVVEVVSPGDSRREVLDKVSDWLRAGVQMAWVIYPATRSATVFRSPENSRTLTEDDLLDGEDAVPGFTCRVGDLFD